MALKRAIEAIRYGAIWSTVGWGLWAMLALVLLGVAFQDGTRYLQLMAFLTCVPFFVFVGGVCEFLSRTSARRANELLDQQGSSVTLKNDDPD